MSGIVRTGLVGLGWLAVLAAAGSPAAQEERRFAVHGYVQWLTGTVMQLALDDGTSVAIDLTRVDQGSYQALQVGDGVSVTGVIVGRESRWIADAVSPDST